MDSWHLLSGCMLFLPTTSLLFPRRGPTLSCGPPQEGKDQAEWNEGIRTEGLLIKEAYGKRKRLGVKTAGPLRPLTVCVWLCLTPGPWTLVLPLSESERTSHLQAFWGWALFFFFFLSSSPCFTPWYKHFWNAWIPKILSHSVRLLAWRWWTEVTL